MDFIIFVRDTNVLMKVTSYQTPQILKMVQKTVTLIFLEVEERSGTSFQNGFMLIILDKLQVWFTFRFLNSYLVIQCSKQS